ncbi:MAG: glutamate-1-semialdehyde 2,1-aminomutase [Dehalococcoidia bacterium]|nr:glutamate-1-semialdehyde 2,1-aminomutase [Dehalococcoidia bacterium]
MKRSRSKELFDEAKKYLPGGVDSPVRAFKAVGGDPIFIRRGRGCRIVDEDDNEYIDYVGSWGPLILGHAHLKVVEAVKRIADSGMTFGAPSQLETTLAKIVCDAMPSIEMVRFVSSGTEATMSALRLSRAFTNRDKIIKFSGGYHGHADGLLAKAGSGATTLGVPDSPGIPRGYAENTLIAPYNDVKAVGDLFTRYNDIAAVIVEPVAANMGVILPQPGFLEGLREITCAAGALLIFDEVITGFRLAYGGAQEIYGIAPDLTCLGKIIGGGLPVGAYGGRRDIMQRVAPSGPVYQAGTLSGNPLAMTSGIQTLRLLNQPGVYSILEQRASSLEAGILAAAEKAGVDLQVHRIGSILTAFFTPESVFDYESAKKADTQLFGRFFRYLLEEGIYWPPSQFEAAFISLAHDDEDIDRTLEAIDGALAAVAKAG